MPTRPYTRADRSNDKIVSYDAFLRADADRVAVSDMMHTHISTLDRVLLVGVPMATALFGILSTI